MPNQSVADYLRTTPLVQWQQQKLLLTLDDVAAAARAKKLRFAKSDAINTDDYVVYASDGRLLRRGTLSGIRFFIDRY
jgi:hypothetical protein